MSRKDYVAIARTISETREYLKCKGYSGISLEATHVMAHRIADTLAEDNPRFNRDRFMAACGIE